MDKKEQLLFKLSHAENIRYQLTQSSDSRVSEMVDNLSDILFSLIEFETPRDIGDNIGSLEELFNQYKELEKVGSSLAMSIVPAISQKINEFILIEKESINFIASRGSKEDVTEIMSTVLHFCLKEKLFSKKDFFIKSNTHQIAN